MNVAVFRVRVIKTLCFFRVMACSDVHRPPIVQMVNACETSGLFRPQSSLGFVEYGQLTRFQSTIRCVS
jgi:hypothetical protein